MASNTNSYTLKKILKQYYLNNYNSLAPYVYFDAGPNSKVAYLSLNNNHPIMQEYPNKFVIFSSTHRINETILLRLLSLYNIETLKNFDDPCFSIQIPKIMDANIGMETLKLDLNNFFSNDVRRLLFLTKKTQNLRFLNFIAKEKFLVPVKIEKNRMIPLILKQSLNVKKDHNKEVITDNLLMVFSDSFSYKTYFDNHKTELVNYNPILMTFNEIYKSIEKCNLLGLYINAEDYSVYNKNIDYILKLKYVKKINDSLQTS